MSGSPGAGYNVTPWRAFYRIGLLEAGVITTAADVNDGDESIELSGLPSNMFAGVAATSPAVGKGQRLILDPGVPPAENNEVFIRDFVLDPATEILLRDPVAGLSGTLSSGADVAMAIRSPLVLVDNYPKRAEFILTIHGLDDQGNDVSATPAMSFEIWMAGQREGPYFLKTGLLSPPIVAPTGTGAARLDVVRSVTVELPALNYLQVEVTAQGGDGGDTVFTLEMVRSER